MDMCGINSGKTFDTFLLTSYTCFDERYDTIFSILISFSILLDKAITLMFLNILIKIRLS